MSHSVFYIKKRRNPYGFSTVNIRKKEITLDKCFFTQPVKGYFCEFLLSNIFG